MPRITEPNFPLTTQAANKYPRPKAKADAQRNQIDTTQDIRFLDEAYPEIDIEFVVVKGKFGPELIQELSDKWHVPTNLMFIGSPGGKLVYDLAELGGVRLII